MIKIAAGSSALCNQGNSDMNRGLRPFPTLNISAFAPFVEARELQQLFFFVIRRNDARTARMKSGR